MAAVNAALEAKVYVCVYIRMLAVRDNQYSPCVGSHILHTVTLRALHAHRSPSQEAVQVQAEKCNC